MGIRPRGGAFKGPVTGVLVFSASGQGSRFAPMIVPFVVPAGDRRPRPIGDFDLMFLERRGL
jgi:hypothetical protein